jgi:hypothetical protein
MAGPAREAAGAARTGGAPGGSGAAPAGSPPGSGDRAAPGRRAGGPGGGERSAPRGRWARWARWAWPAAFAVAGIALFAAYIRLSATYPVNSDGANIVLMAWDMVHGNLLLHAWSMSDVAFYTTELPQYMLLDAIRGLSPGVTHIAAAMTYALALVLAALLAKGRAAGREGVSRVLVTGGIMLAPQLGVGIFVLLLSVGHIGTAVPVLLTWLVLDLARPRWYVPVVIGVLLAWADVADSLVMVVAIAPLVFVCAVRVVQRLVAGRPLREAWYELSLPAAAIVAVPVAAVAGRLIHAIGGYTLHSVPFSFVSAARWPAHLRVTAHGVLALFGANFTGLKPGAALVFAILHLAGLALVVWAVCLVAWRFLRPAGLVDQILTVAIVVNLAIYVPSTLASGVLNAREFAVVLPFGAALAGRVLGPRLAGTRLVPVLLAVLAGYVACLGYEVAQPAAPPANARLATWLQAHHLEHGLSGYWQASSVTLDSGGQVTIRAVVNHGPGLVPYRWESKSTWFDPATQQANFVVLDSQPGFFNYWMPASEVRTVFGQPAATYHTGPYTVLVWHQNLLTSLRTWQRRHAS